MCNGKCYISSISRSTSRKKKPKASKAKIYVKRDNQLVNIKEEDTGTFSVTMTNPTSSNIKVAVRLRPLNQKEIDDDQFEITQLLDKNVKGFGSFSFRLLFSGIPSKCSI